MSADLERDLLASDDGLRDVVDALRRAPRARVPEGFSARVLARLPRAGGFVRFRPRFLSPSVLFAAAASLVAVCTFVSLVFRPVPTFSVARLAACQRAERGRPRAGGERRGGARARGPPPGPPVPAHARHRRTVRG